MCAPHPGPHSSLTGFSRHVLLSLCRRAGQRAFARRSQRRARTLHPKLPPALPQQQAAPDRQRRRCGSRARGCVRLLLPLQALQARACLPWLRIAAELPCLLSLKACTCAFWLGRAGTPHPLHFPHTRLLPSAAHPPSGNRVPTVRSGPRPSCCAVCAGEGTTLAQRHAVVLGLKAFVLSTPYDVPGEAASPHSLSQHFRNSSKHSRGSCSMYPGLLGIH